MSSAKGFLISEPHGQIHPLTPGLPVEAGEVLLSKINPRIPRVIVAPALGQTMLCSSEFEVMRPKGQWDSYTIAYLLLSPEVQKQVQSLTSGNFVVTQPDQVEGPRRRPNCNTTARHEEGSAATGAGRGISVRPAEDRRWVLPSIVAARTGPSLKQIESSRPPEKVTRHVSRKHHLNSGPPIFSCQAHRRPNNPASPP